MYNSSITYTYNYLLFPINIIIKLNNFQLTLLYHLDNYLSFNMLQTAPKKELRIKSYDIPKFGKSFVKQGPLSGPPSGLGSNFPFSQLRLVDQLLLAGPANFKKKN